MSDDKLEKIENNKQKPNPSDILQMARVYQAPELCNYYCHYLCEIGEKYVPELPESSLHEIILNLIDSLDDVQDSKRILVKISADGTFDEDEVYTLAQIQNHLEKVAIMSRSLQMFVEKKIQSGEISQELYEKAKAGLYQD